GRAGALREPGADGADRAGGDGGGAEPDGDGERGGRSARLPGGRVRIGDAGEGLVADELHESADDAGAEGAEVGERRGDGGGGRGRGSAGVGGAVAAGLHAGDAGGVVSGAGVFEPAGGDAGAAAGRADAGDRGAAAGRPDGDGAEGAVRGGRAVSRGAVSADA